MSLILDIGQSADTWSTLKIYQGTGDLGAWKSFGILAGWLFSLGITIRGVVILYRAINSPTPGDTVRALIQLVIGIAVFGILWKISGL